MAKESIIQANKVCYYCQTPYNLHKHHIFYGIANRKKSEQDGCWCWLCARHHNMSDEGVHFDKEFDLWLKQVCESRWLQYYEATIEDFIKRYGKNYI